MNSLGNHRQRRLRVVTAGHTGDLATVVEGLADPEDSVRAVAAGALARLATTDSEAGRIWAERCGELAADPAPTVRRRVAEAVGRGADPGPPSVEILTVLVGDPDGDVAETAVWATGEALAELPPEQVTGTAELLSGLVTQSEDPLVREAAVAALGSLVSAGLVDGRSVLAPILAATGDRPAVRRRAVIALAPVLDEPEAQEAIQRATEDRDWQVREAAAALAEAAGGD